MILHLQYGSDLTAVNRSHPISRLPVELLDEIFSIIAETEINHLMLDCKRCALVCRTWAALCRKYIFKTLTISGYKRAQAFQATAQANKSIEYDVRNLEYHLKIKIKDVETQSDVEAREAELQHLNSILTLFFHRKVKSFLLDFYDAFWGDEFPWHRVPQILKKSLMTFIRSNPITCIELFRISGLPATYLTPKGWLRPTLTKLHVEWVTICETTTDAVDKLLLGEVTENQAAEGLGIDRNDMSEVVVNDDGDNASIHSEVKVPKLQRFGIAECDLSGLVASMRRYSAEGRIECHPLLLSFTELKELLVSLEPLAMSDTIVPEAVMEFLQYALKSTQCLELLYLQGYEKVLNFTGVLSNNLPLSSLQTLSLIDLTLNICEPTSDPYFGFAEELSRLKSRCLEAQRTSHSAPAFVGLGLQELTIELRDHLSELWSIDVGVWSRLDEVLSGSAECERVFCKLDQVRVYPELDGMEPPGFTRHLKWIRRQGFPHLHANQKVKFDFVVEGGREEGSEEEDSEEDLDDDGESQLDGTEEGSEGDLSEGEH